MIVEPVNHSVLVDRIHGPFLVWNFLAFYYHECEYVRLVNKTKSIKSESKRVESESKLVKSESKPVESES